MIHAGTESTQVPKIRNGLAIVRFISFKSAINESLEILYGVAFAETLGAKCVEAEIIVLLRGCRDNWHGYVVLRPDFDVVAAIRYPHGPPPTGRPTC
jgi:hypothetical protein